MKIYSQDEKTAVLGYADDQVKLVLILLNMCTIDNSSTVEPLIRTKMDMVVKTF